MLIFTVASLDVQMFALFFLTQVLAEPDVQEMWLPNEPRRVELTVAYLQEHRTTSLSEHELLGMMTPRMIVLHWTAGPTVKSTYSVFSSAQLRGRSELQISSLNVSAHYVVDRDGRIVQLLDTQRIARHCIGLNHLSIGIENVGGTKELPLTQEQVNSNVALIRYLAGRYPITHVLGHYEYQLFEEHPYFDEAYENYRTIKQDPGVEFMRSVRAELADLPLNGAPK